ncbi:MAG: hypothetical protein HYU36_11470 [Planctomycetes bacterium]|nr:hypothetical protein [Planctomycetota bacterium]
MKRVESSWLLYGDSVIAGPLLILALVAAVVLSWWWLKGEKRRKGLSGALLPYTWTLLLALTVWLAWQPTLVKITRHRHPGSVLVYVDESSSMERSLTGDEISQKLNGLPLWHPDAARQRVTAPQDLERALQAFLDGLRETRDVLDQARQEMLQGLPTSEASRNAVNAFPAWSSRSKALLLDECSRVQTVIDALTKEEAAALGAPVAALTRLVEQVHRVPDGLREVSLQGLGSVLQALDRAAQSGQETVPAWRLFQAALDRRFLEQSGGSLKPLLDEMDSRSRRQTADELVKRLQVENLMQIRGIGRREETDLFGVVEQILNSREDDVISHLLLLSDGGQNGPATSDVAKKLKKSGIAFVAVGVGVPESGHDFALLDWQTRRLLHTRQAPAVRVKVKTPPGAQAPCRLSLWSQGSEIGSASLLTGGGPVQTLTVRGAALPEGRHQLTLRLEVQDRSKRNNQADFVVDVVKRVPKALWIGSQPDWDTTYICQALLRAGLDTSQLYWAVEKSPPRRGGSAREVPRTLEQWSAYRLVLLHGAPFKSFSDEDAEILSRFVVEQGGSLVVIPQRDGASYLPALSKPLAWPQAIPSPIETPSLLLPARTDFLPLLRIGVDGPQSARLLASLGQPALSFALPSQQLVLLENASGETLFSLGFYGKGKVYLWGIQGIDRLREYQKAELVDRLLAQWMADAAAPLLAQENDLLATYPPLLMPLKENLLITLGPEVEPGDSGAVRISFPLQPGVGNRIAGLVPSGSGPLAVRAGGAEALIPVVSNPGLEEIHDELDESFLKHFAREAGGKYLSLAQAWEDLPSLTPATWVQTTAQRYPLAAHWSLLCLVAALGALHWSLRKISGLPL